jgi:riboflavin kinase/FMN adenylyltransferase
MKIYPSVDDFSPLPLAVVTSGTFDGVHVGHQKILSRLKEVAQRAGGETVVITFWPHPRMVVKPESEPIQLLSTFEEKAALLKQQGIQHLLRIPFTREFSQISSLDFIQEILVKRIGTKKLVIGYDHRFGHNREGSFEQLRHNAATYGFEVEEIPPQDVDHVTVSSTKIRKALAEADLATANHLLGRPYSIEGQVVKGDKLGRMLGFPTANIELDDHHKLIPQDGIYAVTVEYAQQLLQGMLYIGLRPTVNGRQRVIEVNLFDFSRDIYGERLKVNLVAALRADAHFNDLEALKLQLQKDKLAAIQELGKQHTL